MLSLGLSVSRHLETASGPSVDPPLVDEVKPRVPHSLLGAPILETEYIHGLAVVVACLGVQHCFGPVGQASRDPTKGRPNRVEHLVYIAPVERVSTSLVSDRARSLTAFLPSKWTGDSKEPQPASFFLHK